MRGTIYLKSPFVHRAAPVKMGSHLPFAATIVKVRLGPVAAIVSERVDTLRQSDISRACSENLFARSDRCSSSA